MPRAWPSGSVSGILSASKPPARDLPFHDAAFDSATLLHVGMNIADKQALFTEAAWLLQPGGTFAVKAVMRLLPDDPVFPLP